MEHQCEEEGDPGGQDEAPETGRDPDGGRRPDRGRRRESQNLLAVLGDSNDPATEKADAEGDGLDHPDRIGAESVRPRRGGFAARARV